MQTSTLLMNLHDRVMQEKVLPEEWFINPDNTCKETKNNICIDFVVWLLINLDGTSLWSVNFVYMLVGHTHNKLDRFFSMLKKATQGQTYFTREDLLRVLKDGIRGYRFDFTHLTDVWSSQGKRRYESAVEYAYLISPNEKQQWLDMGWVDRYIDE